MDLGQSREELDIRICDRGRDSHALWYHAASDPRQIKSLHGIRHHYMIGETYRLHSQVRSHTHTLARLFYQPVNTSKHPQDQQHNAIHDQRKRPRIHAHKHHARRPQTHTLPPPHAPLDSTFCLLPRRPAWPLYRIQHKQHHPLRHITQPLVTASNAPPHHAHTAPPSKTEKTRLLHPVAYLRARRPPRSRSRPQRHQHVSRHHKQRAYAIGIPGSCTTRYARARRCGG